jgi:hypothetical protein
VFNCWRSATHGALIVCHAPTENRTLRCAYGAHAVLVLSTGRLYFLFFPLAKQQEPQICVDGQERFQLRRMHVQPTKPGKNLWVDSHHMVTSWTDPVQRTQNSDRRWRQHTTLIIDACACSSWCPLARASHLSST